MTPLAVENVTKHFRQGDRSVAALNGVTLDVQQGQFLAVMGASGSGKSMLLHLMAALAAPDGGRVLVNGQDLGRMNDRELTLFRRRNIGLVFQSFNLIPTLTAEENVALPLMLEGKTGPDLAAKVNELLTSLGLAERRGHRPDAMSGGEQQRVAIARALVGRPRLLLLDEPMSSLDTELKTDLLAELAALQQQLRVTTVYVTHDHEEARALAHRIVLMRAGRVERVEIVGRNMTGKAGL